MSASCLAKIPVNITLDSHSRDVLRQLSKLLPMTYEDIVFHALVDLHILILAAKPASV